MASHTLVLEGLGYLVDDLALEVGHRRRGRQIDCLAGFNMVHLLNLCTLAEMFEEKVLLKGAENVYCQL